LLCYFVWIRQIAIPIHFQMSLHSWLIFAGLTLLTIISNGFFATTTGYLNISLRKISFNDLFFLSIYMLFIVVPAEEIIFRVWIYGYLHILCHSSWSALFLSSIIFGLIHIKLGGWNLASLAVIAGIGYGLIYLWTDNILLVIMSHMVINLVWRILFIPGEVSLMPEAKCG
jgi:membrane protease YdiL (CAAX protease family)